MMYYDNTNDNNDNNNNNNNDDNEYHYTIHPVSITRFPLKIFSPGAGLLRYVCFIGTG